MTRNTNSYTLALQDQHVLWLDWHPTINASALFRRALREEMELRDDDPEQIAEWVERAQGTGVDIDDLREETDSFADLQDLVRESEPDRMNPNRIDSND